MSRNLLLIPMLAIPLSLACIASNSYPAEDKTSKPDESKEPPLKYILKVGDEATDISEGETVRVDGAFNNPEVTLTAQSHRVFPYQGISFKYPRAFTFEADIDDPDDKSWTLSGNHVRIMYFVMKEQLTIGDYADEMVGRIGRKNCELADAIPMKFDDKKLAGTTLTATVLRNKFVIDIYRLPSTETQTKFLVFQDTLDDAGNRSIECETTLDLLSQSSKLEP